MIEVSNSAAQTLQPGDAISFDIRRVKCGNCECWNQQLPTSVKLLAKNGVYSLHFSGNISGATAGTEVQLAIALENNAFVDGIMRSTPSAADVFNNVSTEVLLEDCCCDDLGRVSVINSGTTPVTVAAGASFIIIHEYC